MSEIMIPDKIIIALGNVGKFLTVRIERKILNVMESIMPCHTVQAISGGHFIIYRLIILTSESILLCGAFF